MYATCPPTSDLEHGLVAEASVGGVGGDTAEHPGVHLPHAGHLEDTHWQESVPGQGGEDVPEIGGALNELEG